MGHSDSSAHVSGYGGVCGGDERTAEAIAEARRGDVKQASFSRTLRSAGKWILLVLVRIYQVFLSPFFGGACKFYPSCSRYGYEAITKHGAWRGSVLAMKRLLRCRPFTKGGFDPVPDVVDEADLPELQGLKPRRTSMVDVAAHKDRGRPFANGAQGGQEFAS